MSWTDYDENTWEFAAGKVLKNYQCDGPYRAVKPTYRELYDSDQLDALARKAMAEINKGTKWTLDDQVLLLASKQHDYGHENTLRFGANGVRVRLWDKIARYENLVSRAGDAKNESIQDTLIDMVGYCAIYGMMMNGTFSNQLSGDAS